jgi:hypothetical protein
MLLEIFLICEHPHKLWGPHSLLSNGAGDEVKLATHLSQMQSLKMCGAISSLLLMSSMHGVSLNT